MPVTPNAATKILADLGAYPPFKFDALPNESFVRQSQLVENKIVPFSTSTLWRMVKRGTFPEPVKISDKITAWRVKDIRRWQANPSDYQAAGVTL